MCAVQKLIYFTISTSLVILILVPFVSSSQEHTKTKSTHSINKHHTLELSPKLLFEITLHGFLLWASMGFLMPVGILIIRMSNREECGRRLKIMFYILSVLLVTAGAIMSIKNFENTFNNNHQRIGLALYGVIWLQAFIGFLRPQRGSKGRSVWFFMHWTVGITVSLLGIINIYTGLQAYHKKTLRSVRLWTMIFTAEIAFIAFFYLFQDKWDYIQKQGVILGNEPKQSTEQENSPRDKQKELLRKQNEC
ncbi:cytochrome b561 domain-containing protein At4g18260-like [Cornus florida]|uniref:cytochrome b561 domain-containing protein At4g18260-like n=1 Tax=Cornus florida TaxID=4283 RepID=UPI00289DB14D|nr:cytochrome b561 domain-containing protein At4g18260-like [Cornus florida]